MQKISVTIDLNKLDKTRIQERTYTNGQGQEVVVREYKLDVVPLKEKKKIKDGDTWSLVKSHFVCDAPTKEERESKTNTTIVGDGVVFENKGEEMQGTGLAPEDLPF